SDDPRVDRVRTKHEYGRSGQLPGRLWIALRGPDRDSCGVAPEHVVGLSQRERVCVGGSSARAAAIRLDLDATEIDACCKGKKDCRRRRSKSPRESFHALKRMG